MSTRKRKSKKPKPRNDNEFSFVMSDGHEDHEGVLAGRVVRSSGTLEIFIDGYGTCDSAPGYGPVVFIELYQGELRVIASQNINSEDPTVLDLSMAAETYRKENFEEKVDRLWNKYTAEHLAPSVLFQIGTGMRTQNVHEEEHLHSCSTCKRLLQAYQDTVSKKDVQ